MSKVDEAVSAFKKGYNCSQALFSAYSERMGVDKETAMKIASAFGGGMGCTGETCGAVTGALMVIGLKHGHTKSSRQAEAYRAAKELAEKFKSRNGSTLCRELLRCDIGTDDGMRQAEREKLFTNACPGFVKDAAEIIEEIL